MISDESNGDAAQNGDAAAETRLARNRMWENSNHPFLLFNEDGHTFSFVGFHIDRNGHLINEDGNKTTNSQTRVMSAEYN